MTADLIPIFLIIIFFNPSFYDILGNKTMPESNLQPVRITESHIQRILKFTMECCLKNFAGPESYFEFYHPYLYIFEPKTRDYFQEMVDSSPLPPVKVHFNNNLSQKKQIRESIFLDKEGE